MLGDKQIDAATYYDVDFQTLVQIRDSLIAKGVCEAEPVLEKCSITIDTTSVNSTVVNIGNKQLMSFYSIDSYGLVEAAKKIAMLQAANVCK